ncbi:hypothetical protein IAD21_04759 [Abditibacteriota bacterium]|nr:hypothetical protein IAD21_04759 [Abditibacteriota bacterium]
MPDPRDLIFVFGGHFDPDQPIPVPTNEDDQETTKGIFRIPNFGAIAQEQEVTQQLDELVPIKQEMILNQHESDVLSRQTDTNIELIRALVERL